MAFVQMPYQHDDSFSYRRHVINSNRRHITVLYRCYAGRIQLGFQWYCGKSRGPQSLRSQCFV